MMIGGSCYMWLLNIKEVLVKCCLRLQKTKISTLVIRLKTASPDVSVTSKAHLLCSHVCVDVQYSSKKFGGKFLSVGFERQVKDGREYKIWIREPAQKVAVIAE
uniref:Uncharacterized protein n=1 Tax=Ditylenchus dipsaci TaxID=166011 RepID=A0A915EAN4_9BILA